MDKTLLNNLHQYPEFQILLEELKRMRPVLPTFDLNEDRAKMWEFKSAQQLEFDVMMNILDPFRKLV